MSIVLMVALVQPDNFNSHIDAQGAGNGAPSLKLTWDFSTSTGTNSTAFTTTTLPTFLQTYDAPDYNYTVSATDKTYRGLGNSTDAWPDDNWKFSSKDVAGTATISGLPTYGYVKIRAFLWETEVASLKVNDGEAQKITGNAYNLYEFDTEDSTTFKIDAVKRVIIQRIEFWGC